jgi:biotin-(acetyl-CoA carboxylase) ligase
MESWGKYLSENQPDAISVFYEVCEQKETQRKELLKEFVEFAADLESGKLSGKVHPIGRWSALTAMTGIAATAGLQAAALHAGGAVGVAFFLTPLAIPLAIGGALTYAYFKAKKLLQGFFKNLTTEPSEEKDLLSTAANKIEAMIEAVKEKTGMTQEQAEELLKIINKEVNEDEEHAQIAKDLLKAIDDNDSELVRALTDELDDTVSKIIQRLIDELEQHMKQYADEEESSRIEDTLPHMGQYVTDNDGRRMYAKA